jgi:hypothetical protein
LSRGEIDKAKFYYMEERFPAKEKEEKKGERKVKCAKWKI